jgi:hypothetical protein
MVPGFQKPRRERFGLSRFHELKLMRKEFAFAARPPTSHQSAWDGGDSTAEVELSFDVGPQLNEKVPKSEIRR